MSHSNTMIPESDGSSNSCSFCKTTLEVKMSPSHCICHSGGQVLLESGESITIFDLIYKKFKSISTENFVNFELMGAYYKGCALVEKWADHLRLPEKIVKATKTLFHTLNVTQKLQGLPIKCINIENITASLLWLACKKEEFDNLVISIETLSKISKIPCNVIEECCHRISSAETSLAELSAPMATSTSSSGRRLVEEVKTSDVAPRSSKNNVQMNEETNSLVGREEDQAGSNDSSKTRLGGEEIKENSQNPEKSKWPAQIISEIKIESEDSSNWAHFTNYPNLFVKRTARKSVPALTMEERSPSRATKLQKTNTGIGRKVLKRKRKLSPTVMSPRKWQIKSSDSNKIPLFPQKKRMLTCMEQPTDGEIRTHLILFSGMKKQSEFKEIQMKLGLLIGAKIVDENYRSFNVLVMDEFNRTTKLLVAINNGVDIVNFKWVTDSLIHGKLMPLCNYYYRDLESEKKLNYNLQESLEISRISQPGFLAGMSLWIERNVKPSYSDIKVIAESAGGYVLVTKPKEFKENVVIIMDENDTRNYKGLKKLNYKIYKPELLLMASLQQKLNFAEHEIIHEGSK